MRANDRFCSTCGTPIAAAQAAPVPPSIAPEPARIESSSLQVPALGEAALGEQRKVVTILFADLSGSTPLAEKLDPEDLRGILSSYFNALARQIRRYEGTIDKYIGDAVMAVFGAPLSHEDDAERAIRAALAMQRSIQTLNDDLERQHGVRLSLRIGINTGEVVAGLLGGDVQSAYTVVGDAVNTAQRFESVAPLNQVLVSETTRRLALHAFEFETLPAVTLKGKAEPVAAYRVIRRRDDEIEPDVSPLIGREAELATLRAALEGAVAGAGRLVHIRGEAGVGKSRLATEFRLALGPDIERMSARCASYETNTPYALIAELIRGAFRIHAVDDEAAARAAILAGLERFGAPAEESATELLLDIVGFSGRSAIEPEQTRRLLLLVLRTVLERASQQRPLVIVAEDLQWCDPASREILAELARDITGLRGLFISTARAAWSVPWEAEPLELAPLGERDARALIEEVFEGRADEATVRAVFDRTGGNPFFIEEVSRELKRGGSVVPATVQEVLEARLDRLGDRPGRVVRVAACIGQNFWYRLLEQLVRDGPLAPDLATLEEEAFVVAKAMEPERTYAFRQALIREVAYQIQLLATRRSTHTAIGRALEALYPDRLDEFIDLLAYHYERGEDPLKALEWLTRAGDRARSLYANTEALTLYASALRVARDGTGPLDAAAILERIGDVQQLTGKYDLAVESYRQARGRTPGLSRPGVARLLRKVGMTLRAKGEYDESLVTLGEASQILADDEDVEAARIAVQVGQIHFRQGRYEDARDVITEGVALGERLGADDAVAEGLKLLGNVANNVGDLRGAIELYERTGAAYERLGDLVGIADIHSNLAMLYRRMDRFAESEAAYRESLALREKVGHVWGIATTHNNLGELHRTRGEPLAAIPSYEQAMEIFERIGARVEASVVLMNLGAARVEARDVDRGRADLQEAARHFVELGGTKFLPSVYRDLAAAALAAGELDEAHQSAERALGLARAGKVRQTEAVVQRLLGEIALARGDRDAARELLGASIELLRSLDEAAELRKAEAVLAKV